MFGYVIPDAQSLDADQLRLYRSLYCGLCRQLSKRYGMHARMLLSYDVTFLLLTLEALDGSCRTCFARCPWHLGKKRCCAEGENVSYCADISIILGYLNIEDDLRDGSRLLPRLLLRLFGNAYNKARARQPPADENIRRCLASLTEAESVNEPNPDVPANICGRLLESVFAVNPKARDLGYALGRAVYIMDAACDFKKDIKRKRYNPLIRFKRGDFDKIVDYVLKECADRYEKLDFPPKYREIADNIIYGGIRIKYEVTK